MEASSPTFFVAPTEFLQQGDILCQELVTPIADTEQRLFRTSDGRHGSVVFSDNEAAHVFDFEDLQLHLTTISPRTPLHTAPFSRTPDGHPEMVVVYANRTSYFIIATQSCDVSGQNKSRQETTIICPIITVLEICKCQKIPFKDTVPTTIEGFLENYFPNSLNQEFDPFTYPDKIRKVLEDWKPADQKLLNHRSQVRNFLTNMQDKGWVYFLEKSLNFNIPESYVDFSVAYTVPTSRVEELKSSRTARIAIPYRDQFAQAFANRFSRIAVPNQIRQNKF